jgi:hypothetical protein
VAVLFMDSFSHYTTVSQKYLSAGTAATINTSGGRFGGGALSTNLTFNTGHAGYDLGGVYGTTYSTLVMGAAWKSTLNLFTAEYTLLALRDTAAGVVQCCVRVGTTGKLIAYRGESTALGDSGLNTVVQGPWYYIEMKATVHNTTGAIEVRVNGVTWITLTGVNTRNGTNNYATQVQWGDANQRLGQNQPNYLMCDAYALDTSGSAPTNDFLGDTRVECLMPTGAGAHTDFSRGGTDSGANWSQVEETPPNDATDYVASSTPGQKDSYAFADLASTGGTVYAVAVNSRHQKADAGPRTVRLLARHATVEGTTAAFTPGAGSWEMRQGIFPVNPSTSAAWTPSEVNAAEFGVEVVT